MTTALSKPELLAPAGNLEAFFAALENGADAVYCGARNFSARAKAKNFTVAELERMTACAHARGARLHVTVNCLVKERELPELAELLADLELMGVDAVIVQDMAVWRLAHRFCPGLKLHASTQMTIHNSAGVRMLERMGFSRAVLARELTLEEIAAIRAQTTLELEHFVHGALCLSFAGQCYFSSYLGGKSGNRGRCAQPCRRLYRAQGKEGYYFSTRDLCAVDLLPELTRAGVCSFKIEGRMKSAEYVATVVSAYRRALDAPEDTREEAEREARRMLKSSFGRNPTHGFLTGIEKEDISNSAVTGATGLWLGRVSAVAGGDIRFVSREPLFVGDRLRIQPKSDRSGQSFTIRTLRLGRNEVKHSAANANVTVPTPFKGQFRVGDSVFKVSSEQAFTMSEAKGRRSLEAFAGDAPPQLAVRAELGGDILHLEGHTLGMSFAREYPVSCYPAQKNPLNAQTLAGLFGHLGPDGWPEADFACGDLPPVVIPPSRLKEIRRDFSENFQRFWKKKRAEKRKETVGRMMNALLDVHPPERPSSVQVAVAIGHARDLHILDDPKVGSVIVPLTGENVQERLHRVRDRKDRVIWEVPLVLFDEQWTACRQMVATLVEGGFRCFMLNNLGHFPLFEDLPPVRLFAGWRLFSLNSQAVLSWKELGVEGATLALEDDRANIFDVLARPVDMALAVTLYASVPLLVTRVNLRRLPQGRTLVSDTGTTFRVAHRRGLNILYAGEDFSLVGREAELQQAGCGRFILDLRQAGPFSPTGKRVLASLGRGRELPGTSLFNYGMELE